MRGLTLVLLGCDGARWQGALRLAAAHAALGGATRLFLDAPAVALLRDETPLLATALDLGAAIIACQTGLADAGLALTALDPRIKAGGLTSLLATLGEDRLVTC